MAPKALSRPRRLFFYGIFTVTLLIATLVLAEIGVRIFNIFGPSTFPYRQFDADLGVSLTPGAEGVNRRCYDGYVYVNKFGMRDRKRTLEKPADVFRISVFSDSIMEAAQVRANQIATAVLEKKLNNATACADHCEVLNFSVGGYSTVQSYLRYRRDGRKFDSDLVVLVFTDNDLPVIRGDNKDEATKNYLAVGSLYPSPFVREHNGQFSIIKPQQPKHADSMLFWFRHSALLYHLYKAYVLYLNPVKDLRLYDWVPEWAAFQPEYTFLDPANDVSARAWRATAYVLDRFVEDVHAAGAKFMLVHWGYDVGSNPWYAPIPAGAKLPPTFDPQHAAKWFARYGQQRGIMVYNLGADMARYIKQRKLRKPYLSFSCDTHLNPEGQAFVADALFQQLQERELLRHSH